jgi:carboxypeptidase family protein/TonB-dependent receptor-like protein
MPTPSLHWRVATATMAIVVLAAGRAPLLGQGATVGGLVVTVVDARGAAIFDATVTLEHGGVAVQTQQATRSGEVTFSLLRPGRYTVLAEQLGYQPVRMLAVDVNGGGEARVTLRLTKRPPPINTIEEQPSNATYGGTSQQLRVQGRELHAFDRRHDISGVSSAFSQADVPMDGRQGLLASGNGLRPLYSSLVVDGVPESLLRHPGLPSEPGSTVLFARDGVSEVAFAGFAPLAPTPGTLGSTVSAQTAAGSERFSFRPWATFSSAKLGGNKLDNPGDSTASSIQAGVAMGGPIKGDTASWFLRGDYQQLEQPTAAPFDVARAVSDTSTDLFGAIRTAAQTLGSKDVSSWLVPTVRTWKGATGAGRLDWRFGTSTLLAVRANAASWTETNPLAGAELVNGAGSKLKATDISGAATVTTGAENWNSETRLGVRSAQRDWTGASLAYTGIVGDAVALGGAGTLPGHFKDGGFNLSETFSGLVGDHQLQAAVSYDNRSVTYDWLPGSSGIFQFGDLGSFTAGTGSFYQAIRTTPVPSLGTSTFIAYAQDNWQATPQIQLQLGVRLEYQGLPSGVVAENVGWERVSGFRNTLTPHDVKKQDIAPRAGFSWDVSGSGQTIVRGSAGIVPGQYDLAALAEAVQYDGDVTIRRATGIVPWPQVGAASGTAAGQALTFFADSVRKPKSFKADLSVQQRLGGATTITFGGAYRHADYLLQRSDLNRIATIAVGADERPIFGVLEQYGALLVPKVSSNRRFDEFDMVYALTASGYNDYYEASVALDRHLSRGFDFMLGYTYSKTTDNLPGSLSADPADQLTPFPDGLHGDRWEIGRSDLDIPHRVAATLTYTSAARAPLTVGARFRYRSGLPFTPGFRTGVDANGDGSGANDPVFIAASTSGMAALSSSHSCLGSQQGSFAARNSCRDPGVGALDLRAALPIARGWSITLDGFNLAGTTTGLFDHAAVLVDPKGTITTDAAGHTVLPLVANPGFGQLLSRRGDPRTIRIGFRVEN